MVGAVAARFGLVTLLAALVVACGPTSGSSTATGGAGASGVAASAPVAAVQSFEDQGRQHIAPGSPPFPYNSNPPTSGPHHPQVMAWGIHDRLAAKEVLIHNMEHGGVIVWYNCAGGPRPLNNSQCQDLRNGLTRVVRTALDAKKLIVMGPTAEIPNRIALTAWTKLDAFDEFDAQRVARFIDTYERAYNPEGF